MIFLKTKGFFMSHLTTQVQYKICLLFWSLFFLGIITESGTAAIISASAKMIADSAEPFPDRIYSYDMDIDSLGDVHIVYSHPYSDTNANIYYVRRVSGIWQNAILLADNGLRPSISTLLLVGSDDLIHVCYIESGSDTLHYITINDGTVGTNITVDNGGWHTRMQLDENDHPIFIRENGTSMVMLTTDNGITWNKKNLNLPSVTWFRIADFLYADGTYHLTYGDSAYTFEVWDSKAMTERIYDTFHNLHYAVSSDGTNWMETTVDSSGTLYRMQFWTSMALDGSTPLISMYKYNEYGDRYNYGTSANLITKKDGTWETKIITNVEHPDTLEGMGPGLAVNGPGDYFGAWDFSPDNTYNADFLGPDGNIALARNGPNNDWTPKVQLDPFSLEGRAILRIHGGKLFFLGLGNWRDAKLYFREYDISYLNTVLPPPGGSTGTTSPGGSNKSLPAIYMLLDESKP